MAAKFLLVILTKFLISEVVQSQLQPYPARSYVIRDSRSQFPHQSPYVPNYQSYYPAHPALPIYKKPAEIPAQVQKPYHQPTYQRNAPLVSPTRARPVQYQTKMYPGHLPPVTAYRQPAELSSQGVRTNQFRPTTYPSQLVTPSNRPMSFPQPMYEKTTELRPPTYPANFIPPVQSTYQGNPGFISPGDRRSAEPLPTYPVDLVIPPLPQTTFQQRPGSISPDEQRSVDLRGTYQRNVAAPAVQTTEFSPPSYKEVGLLTQRAEPIYRRSPELVTTAVQPYTPTDYVKPAYQKLPELVSPTIQTIGYQSPIYQKAPGELLLLNYQNVPTFQPIQHQPAYQKVENFVSNHPVEFHQLPQQTANNLAATKQQTPALASLTLESLKALPLQNPERLPLGTYSGSLDKDVLNNLAIALQLLIVNNIINNPKPESVDAASHLLESSLELAYPTDLPTNPFHFHSPCQIPSAKYLGSSSFTDDGIMTKGMIGLGTGLPLKRPGLNLMSPYDSMALTSSPFSEPLSSLMALKNDFQSPYAAILAADSNSDLFSMSDLF